MPSEAETSALLLDKLVSFQYRPYDFVMWAFPWGEPGTVLADYYGPEEWQEKVLKDFQRDLQLHGLETALPAYLAAIKSGKNVGKTGLLSWIIWWAFSTKVNTVGRATANTEKQLRLILWRELAKWHQLFLAKQFFKVTATQLQASDPLYSQTWHFDAVPWSEDNPDAWSGLHNQGGRILMVFDEGSGIHDSIWERGDGATRERNTEVFWFATSNPTKNYGRFYECFHKFADIWHCYTVDSREVALTDHSAIEKAIAAWGESSDYTKVNFLGEFPSSSMLQLIPVESIREARRRLVTVQDWEPLILSVDVARFGNNESVAGFRRGKDARSILAQRRRGLTVVECGSWVAALVQQYSPDAVFIDEGGVGGGVVDFVRHLGHSCVGVNFGVPPTTRPGGILVANKRAEMYVLARDWLREGGCIEDSDDLEDQLISIEYHYSRKQEIQLMSKEDMRTLGRPSPDMADQLVMTFAYPVSGRRWKGRAQISVDYDPLGPDALHFSHKPSSRSERGRPLELWSPMPNQQPQSQSWFPLPQQQQQGPLLAIPALVGSLAATTAGGVASAVGASTIGAGLSGIGASLGGTGLAAAGLGGAAAGTVGAATGGSLLGGLATTTALAGTGLGLINALNPPKLTKPPPPPTLAQPLGRSGSFLGPNVGTNNGTFLGTASNPQSGGGKSLLGQ